MLIIPRNSKFKKQQKRKAFNRISKSTNLFELNFGSMGLKALEHGQLNSKQISTLFQTINKIIKKKGKLKINVFPHLPVTSKPIEVRMGKGKGNVDFWAFNVKPGTILCEIETNSISLGVKALQAGQIRLPVSTRLIFH